MYFDYKNAAFVRVKKLILEEKRKGVLPIKRAAEVFSSRPFYRCFIIIIQKDFLWGREWYLAGSSRYPSHPTI